MAAKNMYPVKKNNWSFRATMIPVPGDGFDSNKALAQPLQELPSELQKRSRVSIFKPPKKVAKEKKHIFQKIEDRKHQNAFKRYQYHCRNYEESKKLAMKQTEKVEEDILMENINLYRLKQENILILEKSKSDLDRYYGENTWEISLRDYWMVEPMIGDLTAVPMPYDLLAQRTLERIGNPLKENMSLDYFTKTDSRQDTRKSRWGPFELYMERLEKGIRTTVPHRPNFHGFQVCTRALVFFESFLSFVQFLMVLEAEACFQNLE
ncbi:uncharacterized protein LOC9635114 isoform X1 [Selaginella moellendorffii]|uniref:uncharacterized protein LOC9635114 isoform X1 n=1 Tax=Selaginella moellendorffii TaxID=88036 RepID=UPI000D1CCE6B|nr:uncharacterized protein LOC9635114 isoform X1 [Selaginella moellendorffii]|eukprot:XP_024520674.1 uncharacterized protein LOC9635114 isoform X1 [Selaginella moellendorffii]